MNVIWFVIDTLRSDHLGCYGYFRDTSPNIDRIASEGVLFEDSYASAIATGPGFTSLFTGRAAINHGFYLTPWNVPNAPLLDDRILTLPELVQARSGATTAAFDNLINFRSHMKQFVRGFEYYVNITRSPAWLHQHVLGGQINARLLPWLEQHREEHFFAFVHYWDPHTPYNMPEGFRGRFRRTRQKLPVKKAGDGYDYVPGWGLANDLPERGDLSIELYDDEVCYVDHCVGEVRSKLEDLGLWEETAVIVTADHGEDLDLHGLWGHGTVHDTTVKVPLIIRDPKSFPQGKRLKGFVQHVDNLPTILEYFSNGENANPLNAPSNWMPTLPDRFDGASLGKLVLGQRAAPAEIVAESGAHRGFLSPPWKLIWYREDKPSELFDLESDPLEIHDRAAEAPDVTAELEGKLAAWVEKQLSGERTDPIFAVQGAWTCYIGKKGDR